MKEDALAFLRPGLAIASIALTFFIIFSEPYAVHLFNDSDEYQLPSSTETPVRSHCLQLTTKIFLESRLHPINEVQKIWVRPKTVIIRSVSHYLIIFIRDLRI